MPKYFMVIHGFLFMQVLRSNYILFLSSSCPSYISNTLNSFPHSRIENHRTYCISSIIDNAGGCTFLNMYECMWVHKRGINLNLPCTTCKYATQNISHSYVHVWRTSRRSIYFLYLYGRVTRLYGISIQYWRKILWIIYSFPYLIHVYMKEAILGFWKGWWSWEKGHFLVRVTRRTTNASLWLMPLLDHGQHQNGIGVDFHVGFLSIIFISLANLQCV